jgi:hypothetical protein
MKRNILLAERLREVLLDGFWVANTNYQTLLADITLEQATTRVGNLNTIAALTFHVNYYLGGLLNALRHGTLDIHDKYSFDLLPLRSEKDWRDLVQVFLDQATQFVREVEQLPEEKLESSFAKEEYGTWLRNIEGTIEHCYYHLGQISLLRKIVQAGNAP